MKFKRSSGQHFVASITHRELCARTLVVVCVGLAGLPGPGSSAPHEQSRWGGNEVRACGVNGGLRRSRSVAGPRGSFCGELTDPGSDAQGLCQDAGASQSSISHSGFEAGQNMVAHSQRKGILFGVRIEPLQTPHAMLAQNGEGRGGLAPCRMSIQRAVM